MCMSHDYGLRRHPGMNTSSLGTEGAVAMSSSPEAAGSMFITHVHAGSTAASPTPGTFLLLAAGSLALRLAST
jgi:hypothetical protein